MFGMRRREFINAARRLGGRMAAHGTRPAARENAAHRRVTGRGRRRSGISGLGRSVPAGTGAIRLDHRSQRALSRTRWAGGKADDIRRHATELAALAPDVILAHGATTVRPLLQATRSVPIVFPIVGDPVGAGFVESFGPAGRQRHRIYDWRNIASSGKWLALLKEIAPNVTRAAVLRDPAQGSGPASSPLSRPWHPRSG